MSQSPDRRADNSTSSNGSGDGRRSRSREGTPAAGPSGRRDRSAPAGSAGPRGPLPRPDPFSAAGPAGQRMGSPSSGPFGQRDRPAPAGSAGLRGPSSLSDPSSAAGPSGQGTGFPSSGILNERDRGPFKPRGHSAGAASAGPGKPFSPLNPFSAAGPAGQRTGSPPSEPFNQRDGVAYDEPVGPGTPFRHPDPCSATGPGTHGGSATAGKRSRGERSSPARQSSRAAGPATMGAGQGLSKVSSHKLAIGQGKPPLQRTSHGFTCTDPRTVLEKMKRNLPGSRRSDRAKRSTRRSDDEDEKEVKALLATYSTVLADHPLALTIDTEIRIKRDQQLNTPTSFRDHLVQGYRQHKEEKDARFPTMVLARVSLETRDVWRWKIFPPRAEQNSHTWRVQFQGPQVELRNQGHAILWRAAFKDGLWKYLNDNFAVHAEEAETQRETEIILHTVGSERLAPFGLPEFKAIARAVIYFDAVFNTLLRFHRTSNFDNTKWQTLAQSIQDARTHEQLQQLMQPPLSPRGPGGPRLNFDSTWVFAPAGPGLGHFPLSVVKFRNPGPCTTAQEILCWAELALSFVHAALQNPDLEQFKPSTKGLWAFMETYFIPGMSQPWLMAPIFMPARARGNR